VDFVLYGEGIFQAIEMKNATQVHPSTLRSLKTFLSDYPEATGIVLYRGPEKLMIDGVPCWPIDEFLLQLKPNHWPCL